jgi:RimJ/RimL family protein N-acetyltransferase
VAREIDRPLFRGDLIYLAAVDPEEDAPVLAGWTHDGAFMRLVDRGPLKPLTAAQVKEQYQDQSQAERTYVFVIRRRSDDRAVGFARLERFQWTHQTATLQLGIADPPDRGHGYGREALALMIDYAFSELNLHRLAAVCPGDNAAGIEFLEQMGFRVEVRRREAVHRDGRRWDLVHLGLLGHEWRRQESPG